MKMLGFFWRVVSAQRMIHLGEAVGQWCQATLTGSSAGVLPEHHGGHRGLVCH